MKARNVKPGEIVPDGSHWHAVISNTPAASGMRAVVYADGARRLWDANEPIPAAKLTDAQTFALRLIGTGTVKLSGTRFVDDEHWQPLRAEPIQRLRVYGLADLDGEKDAYHRPVVPTQAGRVLLALLNAKQEHPS